MCDEMRPDCYELFQGLITGQREVGSPIDLIVQLLIAELPLQSRENLIAMLQPRTLTDGSVQKLAPAQAKALEIVSGISARCGDASV